MIKQNIKPHLKRLNSKNIVIEERFLNEEDNSILYYSSDFKKNDTICKRPRIEKVYFHNGKEIYTQKDFNKKMKYTYFSSNKSKEIIECPSCGYQDEAKKFVFGCPYCDTDFSLEISKKKEKISNKVIKDTSVFGVILLLLSFLVRFEVITFEMFLSFLTIGLVIEGIVLFIQFIPLLLEKDIWHDFKTIRMNINEKRVYSDLNTELSNYYYDDKNTKYKDLIDFDILKYQSATYDRDGNDTCIVLSYLIRKYYYIEKTNTIEISFGSSRVRLIRNVKQKHKSNSEFASKCKNCGSSIEFHALECEYCGSKNESTIGWKIKEILNDNK